MSVHNGHRMRVKEKFLEHGFEGMHQHEILEYLLYFAIPRGDTNPLAHELINKFGGISEVFEASYEELMKVKGVGDNTAMLIKSIVPLSKVYAETSCKINIINSTKAAGEYLMPKFIGKLQETFLLTMLDNKSNIIKTVTISEGSVNQVSVNIRKIIELSLKYNAASVVLAHNHPKGIALPSLLDIATTKKIKEALLLVNVVLIDHIIVADDDFVSLSESKKL